MNSDLPINEGLIFDIKRDCSEDGPGIRTTVFFKGCPLSCIWCQNPEGQTKAVKFSYDEKLCQPKLCHVACLDVCEAHCFSFVGKLQVNAESCTRCNKCFDVCPTKALTPVGYKISLQDLMYQVLIDVSIYQASGGGVTLSGGEATQQMAFAGQFLKALKSKNIHTALETSGFFNYRRFQQRMLPFLDLIYFDLKIMDEEKSRQYTGQSNKLILSNFEKLVKESTVEIRPRVPLIPGITDTKENLSAISKYLKSLGMKNAVLMPYNPLWLDKVKRLGVEPKYDRCTYMTKQEQAQSVHWFSADL